MRLSVGWRQLLGSAVNQPAGSRIKKYPAAVNATDHELARLNALSLARRDRARWEANALLYGAARPDGS